MTFMCCLYSYLCQELELFFLSYFVLFEVQGQGIFMDHKYELNCDFDGLWIAIKIYFL